MFPFRLTAVCLLVAGCGPLQPGDGGENPEDDLLCGPTEPYPAESGGGVGEGASADTGTASGIANSLIGFSGDGSESGELSAITGAVELDLELSRSLEPTGRSLSIDKDSGVVRYEDDAVVAVGAAAVLPSDSDAVALARDYLGQLGLRPLLATTSVQRVTELQQDGSFADTAVEVNIEPRLQVGIDAEGKELLAPLRGFDVTVLVGDGGELMSIRSAYQPAVPFAAERVRSVVRAEAEIEEIAPVDEDYRLGLAYIDSGLPGGFLDPVYEGVPDHRGEEPLVAEDSSGHSHSGQEPIYVWATEFSPRSDMLFPETPEVEQPAFFEPFVEGGDPPYRVQLVSDIDGLFLTMTSDADGDLELPPGVTLAPGHHTVTMTVTDSKGAGHRAFFPLEVNGLRMPDTPFAAGAAPLENDRSFWQEGINGIQRTLLNRGLVLDHIALRTRYFIERLSLWGFKFELKVYMGETNLVGEPVFHSIRSTRCVTGYREGAGSGACDFPQAPFATVKRISGRSVSIENLPGTLDIDFNYKIDNNVYAGAPKSDGVLDGWGHLARGAAWATNAFKSRYVLGAPATGLIPEVEWNYRSPTKAGGYPGIKGSELRALCAQASGVAETCDQELCGVPVDQIDDNMVYPIAGLDFSFYMGVEPQRSTETNISVLTEDSPSKFGRIARSDGTPLTCPPASGVAPRPCAFDDLVLDLPDIGKAVPPMQMERSVVISRDGNAVQFENWHAKRSILSPPEPGETKEAWWDHVIFPGCNDPFGFNPDNLACVHMHESWYQGKAAHEDQIVSYHTVNRSDKNTACFPEQAVGGALGDSTMMFVQARASTDGCAWGLRRKSFVAPIFFTPLK